jgi:hypothetical protein
MPSGPRGTIQGDGLRPPALDEPGWSDPARLDAAFDNALGSELP